jgi:hypothetical protein
MIILIGRPYRASSSEFLVKEDLYYQVGQPMGALTSWGMLALTHHALVQLAAERAGVTAQSEWFADYAILGDDIVIANGPVAEKYVQLMASIGVGLNLSKSLVSVTGRVVEFAKRTLYKGQNISPLPVKELYASMKSVQTGVQFALKYKLSPAAFLTLFGAKYRVLGKMQQPFFKQGVK